VRRFVRIFWCFEATSLTLPTDYPTVAGMELTYY
jgi:hypothetical protein